MPPLRRDRHRFVAATDAAGPVAGVAEHGAQPVQAVHIPALRALDIDTEMDLRFAEFLLAEGHVKP